MSLQGLLDKYQLTTSQVNREIQQIDIPYLALHFDNVKLYVDAMELTPGQQNDVQKSADTHEAMIKCLKIWKGNNPAQATFRTLLEMLVKLMKGEIAGQVCQYLKVSLCAHFVFLDLLRYNIIIICTGVSVMIFILNNRCMHL